MNATTITIASACVCSATEHLIIKIFFIKKIILFQHFTIRIATLELFPHILTISKYIFKKMVDFNLSKLKKNKLASVGLSSNVSEV